MAVIQHLREILTESIDGPLVDIGIRLTENHFGYTVAHYTGRKGCFDRSVIVSRDKWWSKNCGRFTVFLVDDLVNSNLDEPYPNRAEIPLGDLMGRRTSDWKIWATDSKSPFIDELKCGMLEFGIPWFERVSNSEGFSRWQEKNC